MTISSPVGTVTTFQFNPSGTIEDWTVPFHDGPMEVLCIGGAGSRQGPVPNGSGGGGGSIRGLITLSAGTILHMVAAYGGTALGAGGGPNLGGEGGTRAGGGSSDVRMGGTTTAHRILVAGGGGAAGVGGAGGGSSGGGGGQGHAHGSPGGGTGGGNATGGTHSAPGSGSNGGLNAVGGVGGMSTGGAGGGGGYFGGGGGGFYFWAGGGAGGSSWADTSLFSSVAAHGSPWVTANGVVRVTLDYLGDWFPPSSGWSVGFLKF